jgi:hypothetical protein
MSRPSFDEMDDETPPMPPGPSHLQAPPVASISHLANNVAALVAAQHEANEIARAVALLTHLHTLPTTPIDRARLRQYAMRLLDHDERS